jgi:two-component system cell cycle response regulator CpdR
MVTKALILEDNALVRSMTSEMLTELGYCVIAVDTVELATRALDEYSIPVLPCNVSLPGQMTGVDLIKHRATALPPTIIVMSGDPEPVGLPYRVRYLAKPFTMTQLARACSPSIANDA